MKQSFAILLLSIHLFNICGYQAFYSLAESAANNKMIQLLDADAYSDADLIQLKLPLNIPYTVSKPQYERCNGEIVLNGIQYNYVKRMVQNDTLYLYCVPNLQKTEINNSKTHYAKQICGDVSGKRSEQNTTSGINFLKEYSSSITSFNFDMGNCLYNHFFVFNNCSILQGFPCGLLQPPDTLSYTI